MEKEQGPEKEVIGSYTIEPIGTDCMGRVVARLTVTLSKLDKSDRIDPSIHAPTCPVEGDDNRVSYQWGCAQGRERVLHGEFTGDSWDQAYSIARSRVTEYVEFLQRRREMERTAPPPEQAEIIVR